MHSLFAVFMQLSGPSQMALVEHYMVDGQIIAPTTAYECQKAFKRILPIALFLDAERGYRPIEWSD